MTRLTDAELVNASQQAQWAILWGQGLPLVRLTIAALNRQGGGFAYDEDTLQQAALFVGEAVRAWRPVDCAFSTWVVNSLGWRLRSWQRQQLREQGLYVVSDEDEETSSGRQTVDLAVYEDAPLGFGDPLDEAIRLEEQATLLRALERLTDAERRIVVAVYGLDGLGGMTTHEYARSAGISPRGAFQTLDQARQRLLASLSHGRRETP